MNSENYILVTGSSSGIGKEIAVMLSKSYNVILHGRDTKRLSEVLSLCSKENGQIIWQQDLNISNEIETSLTKLISLNNIFIEKFVHCAGYMKMAPLKVASLEVLNKTFNTNVISASLICKVLTSKKINNSQLSASVFISSNISNMGAGGLSTYGASKGALDTLMRCLAVELAPKVRFNSVLPGAIPTEMTQNIFQNEEVINRMFATYPLGLGEPNDIFNMVSFLLFEKSKWVTGQQFTVDGGRSINISG
jgi:NAD(P)-dependent dehydrogenase (short-subunit alcohol dehydrogenase family)